MLATTPNRSTVPLAALLLVVQALAGGAVALAHASEHFSAPTRIEAQHDASCLALHDELRCALCYYAGTRARPQPAHRFTGPIARPEPPRAARIVLPASRSTHFAFPPRAPPVSQL